MGQWGTVCDDMWDMTDATVACPKLGYSRALSAEGNAHYGSGSGKIWMDDVSCIGNELGLQQCPFRGFGRNDCMHFEDAGITCGKMM